MHRKKWEEILSSPKGMAMDVNCPSPERIELEKSLEFIDDEVEDFKKIPSTSGQPKLQKKQGCEEKEEELAEVKEEGSLYVESQEKNSQEQEEYMEIPLLPKKKSNKNKRIQKRRTHRKGPQMKNLKRISKEVFDMVSKSQIVSYPDLCKKLGTDHEVTNLKKSDEVEENNVKRRLYDAINVLHSLGLVEKEKGSINAGITYIKKKKVKSLPRKYVGSEILSFQKQTKKLEQKIKEKRQLLKKMNRSKQSLLKLLTRNEANILKQEKSLRRKKRNGEREKKSRRGQLFSPIPKNSKFNFPLFMFEFAGKTPFSKTESQFSYRGKMCDAHTPLDLLHHINFEAKAAVANDDKRQKKNSSSESNK